MKEKDQDQGKPQPFNIPYLQSEDYPKTGRKRPPSPDALTPFYKRAWRRLKLSKNVLPGMLLMSLILLGIGAWLIYSAKQSEELEARMQQQARMEYLKLQQRRNEALTAQDNLQLEQQWRQQEEQKRREQRELLSKMNQADSNNKDKQAKWERFYQKNPLCAAPTEWKHKVDCANERLKAEEEFEALYKAGKL